MRTNFSNLDRPKTAAKYLVRLSPQLKLSQAQESLARAMGYRDWYDLAKNGQSNEVTNQNAVSSQLIIEIALKLGSSLDMLMGDIQFALTKARMFNGLSNFESQLALRAAIFRQHNFGEAKRKKPGTIVRAKVRGWGDMRGYLLRTDRATQVLFDDSIGTLANFEVVTPRVPPSDFLPSRLWLPYGYWTLADGSRVIYARDYLPLWRVSTDGAERLEPWWWITGVKQNFNFAAFFNTPVWNKGAARDAAIDFLTKNGVQGLPRLVEVMPHLVESRSETIDILDSMSPLREKWLSVHEKLPSYARDRGSKLAWLEPAVSE